MPVIEGGQGELSIADAAVPGALVSRTLPSRPPSCQRHLQARIQLPLTRTARPLAGASAQPMLSALAGRRTAATTAAATARRRVAGQGRVGRERAGGVGGWWEGMGGAVARSPAPDVVRVIGADGAGAADHFYRGAQPLQCSCLCCLRL